MTTQEQLDQIMELYDNSINCDCSGSNCCAPKMSLASVIWAMRHSVCGAKNEYKLIGSFWDFSEGDSLEFQSPATISWLHELLFTNAE